MLIFPLHVRISPMESGPQDPVIFGTNFLETHENSEEVQLTETLDLELNLV